MKSQSLLQSILSMPHCTQETKVLFSQQFMPLELRKGQLLILPTRLDESLYHVESGLLRSYTGPLRGSHTMQIHVSGSFLSQPGCYLRQPVNLYTESMGDAVVMMAAQGTLETFFQREPAALKLLLCILERIQLMELATGTMLRSSPALERYRHAEALLGRDIYQVPREILASYLDLSRKHLGRISTEKRNSSG